MTIAGCRAQVQKLMDISNDDVGVIEESLQSLMDSGVPRKKAQVQAVESALAMLQEERAMVEQAIADQLLPQLAVEQPELVNSNELDGVEFQEPTRIPDGVRYSQREYSQVLEKYKGTNQWMKAPNGQPTKLNEKQWVQVRTQAFKDWFGDWEAFAKKDGGVWSDEKGEVSKAVDENGEPLVVFHGTTNGGFMEFRQPGGKQRGDIGIFTTDNYDMARSYVRKGRVQDITPPDRKALAEAASVDFYEYQGRTSSKDTEDRTLYGYSTPYGDEVEGFTSMEDAVTDAANEYADESDLEDQPGVYALFANIRNPYEADFEGALWSGSRDHQWVVEFAGEVQSDSDGKQYFDSREDAIDFAETFRPGDDDGEFDAQDYVRPADEHYETTDSVAREGISSGDGAIIHNVIDDGGGPGAYMLTPARVFVLANPEQVKSADFNTGTFSAKSADLRYSKRPTEAKQKQDPAVGDKTDVSQLPNGKEIPASVAVGGLASSFEIARGKTYTRGRELKQDIQAAVQAAAKAAGVNLTKRTKAAHRFLSGMVFEDAMYALKTNENAIGWYDSKVSRAIGAISVIHPEINTSKESRLAFLWALAVTSNGLKVDKNFELAESAYRQWKESHSDVMQRVMPTSVGIGNAAKAINDGMEMFNTMVATLGHEQTAKFMATEFPAGDITRMLGHEVGGEWKGTPVRGAAILGPKIGNGFYMNLNGYFDALTMDRWLMRTFGRMTGTLLDISKESIESNRGKLKAAIAGMTQAQRRAMSDVVGMPVKKDMTRAELDAMAAAVDKASMKTDKRKLMQADDKTDRFRLDARGLAKAIDGQKEAPSGPAERNWIRAIFATALEKLREAGKGMTMSDLQALLWYPERRLYDAAKADDTIEEGYEDDDAPDYANAAMKLAIESGANREDVLKAMDAAEARGTVRAETLSDEEKSAMLSDMRAAPEQQIQMAFEVAPDPANEQAVEDWKQLDAKQRADITASVKDAVLESISKAVGVSPKKIVGSTGGFAGMINPNLIAEYQVTKVSFDDAKALAAAIGYVLDQDSVALSDPRSEQQVDLVRLTFNKKPDAYVQQIFDAIKNRVPEIDAFTLRGSNFDVLNFTGLPNRYIIDQIRSAIDALDIPLTYAGSSGKVKSELVERNGYEGNLERVRPEYRERVRAELDGLRDRAREIVSAGIDAARAGRAGAAGLAQQPAQPARRSARGDGGAGRAEENAGQGGAERAARGSLQGQAAGPGVGQQDSGAGGQGRAGRTAVGRGAAQPGQVNEGLTPLPGAPTADPVKAGTTAGPDPRLVSVAEQYAKDNGINLRRQSEYVKVDPERAKRIADAYAAMPHAPQDPAVKEAYDNLIRQTTAQYRALEKAGYKFWLFGEKSDPYSGNPWSAMADLRENQSMAVFATADGFGTNADFNPENNPLLADTGIRWPHGSPDGELKPVLANDLFRAVHDAFGHGLEGAGFRAQGEENAWQAHIRLFTGSAQGAITSETRGQNSWLNFGPKGEKNQTASVFDTDFADQKTGLMPEWTWTEGRAGDQVKRSARNPQEETPAFKAWFKDSKVVDADGKPLVVYHGTVVRPDTERVNGMGDIQAFDRMFTTKFREASLDTVGSWFSTNPGNGGAEMYSGQYPGSTIYPVYLSIQNPQITTFQLMQRRARLLANGKDDGRQIGAKEVDAYRKWLQDIGKDGVKIEGSGNDGSTEFDNQVAWIALEPEQIKSATGNNGQFSPKDKRIQYSNRDPLGYYSALTLGIEGMQTKAAMPGAWLTQIKGLLNKGAVKSEELEWTGLEDWLKLQDGKVSKDQILEYLKANGVQVQETQLTGAEVVKKYAMIEQGTGREVERFDTIEEADQYAQEAWLESGKRRFFEIEEVEEENASGTKYDKYALPGGENYREVLLTLPPIGGVKYTEDNVIPINDADDPKRSQYFWRFKVPGNELQISKQVYRTHEEAKAYILKEKQPEPPADKNYQSNHWDQKNVLAHIRVNDRTDADGNKVLFVEELQSDWGQDGKKKGFDKAPMRGVVRQQDGYDPVAADDWESEDNAPSRPWAVYWEDGTYSGGFNTREQAEYRLRNFASQKAGSVPSAPFVTKTDGWLSLALKRVIAMAVDGGYDKVAFVNGEQSAERYDLSKKIQSLSFKPENGKDRGYLEAWDENRRLVLGKTVKTEDLPDHIGKEVSDRLLSTEPMMGKHLLDGEQLKVGGEGMKTFYDKIVPNAVKAILKKVGGNQIEMVDLSNAAEDFDPWDLDSATDEERAELEATGRVSGLVQPGFTITDAMREKVSGGQPLFSKRDQDRSADPAPKEIASIDKDMEELFRDLKDARGLKLVRVKERVSEHPMAQDIERVHAEFYDILEQLDDSGLININCK